MTVRGYALRLIGLCLMAIALVFWYLESQQHQQPAVSSFFIAIFTDSPRDLEKPTVLVTDRGRHLDVRLVSAVPGIHAQIVTAAPGYCTETGDALPEPSNADGYYRLDVTLDANVPSVVSCVATKPPRTISFTRRELSVGMIWPYRVARIVSAGFVPIHELRLQADEKTLDSVEYSGGLVQAVLPDPSSSADVQLANANVRYLSRYGAQYAPWSTLQWVDYWAELFWAIGLLVLGALLVLLANAVYNLFRPQSRAADQ